MTATLLDPVEKGGHFGHPDFVRDVLCSSAWRLPQEQAGTANNKLPDLQPKRGFRFQPFLDMGDLVGLLP